jgi:hypothetical protein
MLYPQWGGLRHGQGAAVCAPFFAVTTFNPAQEFFMTDIYQPPVASLDTQPENTSGQGANAVIPEGVQGWSWGAFFFNWIWAVGNSTWIGLIALLPYVGFVMAIVLGVKGREWAWRNKRWESLEEFQRIQRLWSVWAGVFMGLLLVVLVVIVVMGLMES